MAEQQELEKQLERQSLAGGEDGSGDQKSNYNLLLEKQIAVYQKLRGIADKEDLVLALLKRVNQTVSEPTVSMSHELTQLESSLQDVKAQLNQVQGTLDLQTEFPSGSLVDLDLLFSEEGNSGENESKSTQDALRQAEQEIKHLSQQLELKESIEKCDGELTSSNGNIIQRRQDEEDSSNPRDSQLTSVMVGRGNTAVIQSTVNIINIGEKVVQLDSPEFIEMLKSMRLPLMSSIDEGPQKQPLRELPSNGAAEMAGNKPESEEQSKSLLQNQQVQEHSSSVVYSGTVTATTIQMNGGVITKDYIEDYCVYKIRQVTRNAPNYEHMTDDPCNPVAARIREIGTEVEKVYPGTFEVIINQLNINPNTEYAQFKHLADELFRETNQHQGISWGRIAILIVFTGRLAMHCARHNMNDMVPRVIGWTAGYLDNSLNNWIEEHDGWDGFMNFFEKDKAGERVRDVKSVLVLSACKYAVIGAGMAVIASILRQ